MSKRDSILRDFFCVVLFSLNFVTLKAQEHVSENDRASLKVDSSYVGHKTFRTGSPISLNPSFSSIRISPLRLVPPEFETKEERAARINLQTFNAVMTSVDQNLSWYRRPKLPKTERNILRIASLFLTDPKAPPDGCVPLMNTASPFVFVKVPGMAPYFNPYTSDQFPKWIESEYDFATGKYRQVMVTPPEKRSDVSNNK